MKMSLSRMLLMALFVCACFSAQAAVDIFLKIESVKGEARDVRHGGEIEVLSWSWGASNPSLLERGRLSGGKASFSDLSLTKLTDSSTPSLLRALATGQNFQRGVLTVRARGGVPTEFHRFYCENIFVTSYATDSANAQNRPSETVGLNFSLAGVRNIFIEPQGLQQIAPDFAWDLVQAALWENGLPAFLPITDTDGDGLPDDWEIANGLDALIPNGNLDSDEDGATDNDEFEAGTSPLAKNSVLKSDLTIPTDGSEPSLTWPSPRGKRYQVFVTDSLDQPFVPFGGIIEAGDGSTSVPIPLNLAHRFFRIQVVP